MVLKKGQQLPPYVGAVAQLPQMTVCPTMAQMEPNIPPGNPPISPGLKRGTDSRKKKSKKTGMKNK